MQQILSKLLLACMLFLLLLLLCWYLVWVVMSEVHISTMRLVYGWPS